MQNLCLKNGRKRVSNTPPKTPSISRLAAGMLHKETNLYCRSLFISTAHYPMRSDFQVQPPHLASHMTITHEPLKEAGRTTIKLKKCLMSVVTAIRCRHSLRSVGTGAKHTHPNSLEPQGKQAHGRKRECVSTTKSTKLYRIHAIFQTAAKRIFSQSPQCQYRE